MGKAVAFFLASVDLAALFALAEFRHQNLADELAMLVSVVGMALLAWGVAVATAVGRAMRGEGWRPVAALLVFLWLPAAPALVYGATGVRDLVARRGKARRGLSAASIVRAKARAGAAA